MVKNILKMPATVFCIGKRADSKLILTENDSAKPSDNILNSGNNNYMTNLISSERKRPSSTRGFDGEVMLRKSFVADLNDRLKKAEESRKSSSCSEKKKPESPAKMSKCFCPTSSSSSDEFSSDTEPLLGLPSSWRTDEEKSDNNRFINKTEQLENDGRRNRKLNLVSGGELIVVNGYDFQSTSKAAAATAAAGTKTLPGKVLETTCRSKNNGGGGDDEGLLITVEVPKLDPETLHWVIEVSVKKKAEQERNQVYQNNLSQLVERGWYFGDIDYKEAQNLLLNTSPGTFLLRASSDKRYMFSMTVQTTRGPTSVRINWVNGKFQLDAEEKYDKLLPKNESMVGLLEAHMGGASRSGQVWVEPNGDLYSHVIITKPLIKTGLESLSASTPSAVSPKQETNPFRNSSSC